MDASSGSARKRMWLNSEKAFGLNSVRAGKQRAKAVAMAKAPAVIAKPASREFVPPVRRDPVAIVPPQMPAVAPPPVTAFAPLPAASLSRDEKKHLLAELNEEHVKGCVRCELSKTRTQTVFGEGDPDASIVFVGEGPGGTEDATGRPFVGRAGQLLDDMIKAMGLRRDQVYIANIVKCRAFLQGPPPKDRPPTTDETATCSPYLVRQLEIIHPKAIVALGLPATKYILSTNQSMSSMRGRWADWRGIKVMPTYHPAYILRAYTEENRRAVWNDLQQVMAYVGLKK